MDFYDHECERKRGERENGKRNTEWDGNQMENQLLETLEVLVEFIKVCNKSLDLLKNDFPAEFQNDDWRGELARYIYMKERAEKLYDVASEEAAYLFL